MKNNRDDESKKGKEVVRAASNEVDLISQLDNFRAKWKQELKVRSSVAELDKTNQNLPSTSHEVNDKETLAADFFFQGVDAEKNGSFYEAVQFYKKAIHLVPDIESICCKSQKYAKEKKDFSSGPAKEDENANKGDDVTEQDLLISFNSLDLKINMETESKGVHVKDLPREILLYILRWVVTSDLDMHSWGKFCQVCREFYVHAQDEGVWKSACQRIWGKKCMLPKEYPLWKTMFIDKPHIKFNGCYISKTSYVRNGETSFQDQFSRPWHLVHYFRYLRFFPEGKVLFHTTPDEPPTALPLLRFRSPRSSVGLMEGNYQCLGNMIVAVCRKSSSTSKHKAKENLNLTSDLSFHLNFEICMSKRKNRHYLKWKSYAIRVYYKGGQEIVNSFDVGVPYNFPPLSFSFVKSYATASCNPL